MKRDTFERLKKMGITFDDDFENLLVKPLESFNEKIEEKQDVNKSLSIKFVSCSTDDKNFNLTFEVSATKLKKLDATVFVQEMNYTNEEAVQTKFKLSSKQKQNVTVSFLKTKEETFDNYFWQDGFIYQATISCDGLSTESPEFKLKCVGAKKDGCTLIEPRAVFSQKLTLTEEQKSKFIATIYAETWGAKNQFEPFSWVYFNLVSGRQGFEKGISNSSAYSDKTYQYKEGLEIIYATGKIKNEDKIQQINKIKEIVENKILVDKPLNPYPGWEGQGYYGDMNIRAPKTGSRRVWAYASQYFHLQNQCKVKSILVKEFKADFKNSKGIRDITGYIYNFNEIEKYFKKNPKNLPEYEIGQCKYDKLSPTQINAIPAVHNVEYCKTNK